MGLRWKIALALAAVSFVATAAVGAISYRTTSASLLSELDRSIDEASSQMVSVGLDRVRIPSRSLLEVYWVRVLDQDANPIASSFPDDVPVSAQTAAVVGVPRGREAHTTEIAGVHVRVHTYGLSGGAVQVARSLEEVDRVLDDLRQRTVLLVLAVSAAAAALGWLIAGSVAAPLSRLTRAAEQVGSSGSLDVAVPGDGDDEVGRLGAAFRDMLRALARSRDEQQRLVQDAGHELRTPLTSVKTNLSVLRRHPDMDPATRAGVLDDLDTEITELTELVNELVAVASGELDEQVSEPVDLRAMAADVAERVGRRRSRDVTVIGPVESWVSAPPGALERAITNLVDNACKFDRSGTAVVVEVGAGTLTVLDRGPGVEPDQQERIFDRFHRTDGARSMPGSGLGLSIVRDVVVGAGGSVFARPREGGGSAIGFTLDPIPSSTAAPLPPPRPERPG